ncbi:DUF5060 domain-containing protein [Muriicola sp. Z0-33]|uniref:DUF5060 domain-containing protein n=1 Tax=Muriicola sp. Z0-33 TaxID=2816957 RepID=UPI00223782B1|nr:DUF5060 domain-containing protein [Muriicola sp. Z0-33]MCW5515553.1 DUF5060 domain-containing protein [Muriicola sp. Z0-33]
MQKVRRPTNEMRANWISNAKEFRLYLVVLIVSFCQEVCFSQVEIKGEQRIWHTTTLLFEGPQSAEDNSNNPFRNYRLNVSFVSPSGNTFLVPGYFAADGNAAETGASSGNKWAVHFTPDEIGRWTYLVSFRTGNEVAVSLESSAGVPMAMDGDSGSFEVFDNNKSLPDNRAKGRLSYMGKRYLKFEGSDAYFIKVGADSPENLLAHKDFDNAVTTKDWSPHIIDWQAGDPVWQGDKGKGLIGAINYLASKGMNAFAFNMFNLDDPNTNNDGGDRTIWPWSSTDIPLMEGASTASIDSRMRYDVSKLAQWEILFSHGDAKGMFLHFKTQERGNLKLLDGGDLGVQRKLYYREIIARFGHHLALNWNLGEEFHIYDPDLVSRLSSYIKAVDPYDHLIVLHTFPGQQERSYNPLLGNNSGLNGASLQIDISKVHEEVKKWNEASRASGKQWIVSSDEQGHWKVGVTVDEDFSGSHGSEPDNRTSVRHKVLWGTLMAGGFGVEYYFGTQTGETDWSSENWRSRATKWEDAKLAYDFFTSYIRFWEMDSYDELTPYTQDYCLAEIGETYVVYLPGGSTTEIDLTNISGNFTVQWFNPRSGGHLSNSDITTISGGGLRTIGQPPGDINLDWVALIQREQAAAIPVSAIAVVPNSLTLREGDIATLTRQITPLNATNLNVVWSSEHPDIATVDQNGIVTAINQGVTEIMVRTVDGNFTATAYLEVEQNTNLNKIDGFTLINAENNTDLLLLTDNSAVYISQFPTTQFNIRADVSGDIVKSIAMQLSGPVTRSWTEHEAPFAMFGDLLGDYYGAALPEGTYTLSGTPFTAIDATGDQGPVKTISFTITADGQLLNQPPTAIALATALSGTFPLTIDFDGTNSSDDYGIATFLWDFDDGNYSSSAFATHTFTAAGDYVVSLTVTDTYGLIARDTILIRVLEPEIIQYPNFTMVAGTTGTDLFKIVDNMLIEEDTLMDQSVNIRADFTMENIQSVAFILNGSITRAWTENEAPYMLFGDHSSKNQGQFLVPGLYTLEARAYSGAQLSGNLLEMVFVAFEVVTNNAANEESVDPKNTNGIPLSQLQDLRKGAIKLHPNPAIDFINAEIIGSEGEISKMLIYDIAGSLVLSYNNTNAIIQSKGVYKIDTSNLPTGVYLLKAYTSTFTTLHYKLVVKEK